ncbi:DUF167 domain-containing protein [Sediminimonas qiaohouensis]|uniref:DUF167 domain-containing protein n=2 Tax=Sediminimonas TaxID=659427 RepID=UPI00047DBE14
MSEPQMKHLCREGAEIAVKVTPKASRNRVVQDEEGAIRVYVTCVPEKGKATAAARTLLAKAMGVPKSRLSLIRGKTARDKVFRLE